MNPAAVSDVEARWRPLSPQEATNAGTFLDDAWLILKSRLPDIEASFLNDNDRRMNVVRVLTAAVLRVLKNPDGLRQESVDDYAYTRDEAVSAGVLYITEDEIGSLVPNASNGVFMVDPLAGRDWSDWS